MPLSDWLAAGRWWAVLLLLGAAAAPSGYLLLRRLPERGYAFSKLLGVLVVSYLFWILGSLGFVGNDLGGIMAGLLGLVGLSLWADRQAEGGFRAWLATHWRQVLVTELVFAAVFGLWVWVRAQNPHLLDTEKPMEFAFLNAVSRSPQFPPLDPWLSGYAISYYYFGYVMTSVLGRLAATPMALAFNLAVAWLAAATATAAFGLVYNLIVAGREDEPDGAGNAAWTGPAGGQRWQRRALLGGLVAAVALPLAGNLEMALEVLHANGIGGPAFWSWLDIVDLNGPPDPAGAPRYQGSAWWWWRASRVIHEYHLTGQPEEGLSPIAEFPGFSFVLGDLHPHVLALPYAFLALAVAFSFWRRRGMAGQGPKSRAMASNNLALDRLRQGRDAIRSLIAHVTLFEWLMTALILGGLSFLNTWDVLIHLFVVVAAFALAQWREQGQWSRALLGRALAAAFVLVVPAILLYLPFYFGFRSQAGAPYLLPMLMRPTRLAHFLVIFGMPLAVIVVWGLVLVWRLPRRPWRAGLWGALALVGGLFALMSLLGWIVASSPEGAGRVAGLAGELGRSLPAIAEAAGPLTRLAWGLRAVVVLAPPILAARLTYPGLTILLAALAGTMVMGLAARLNPADDAPQPATVAVQPGSSPSGSRAPGAVPFVLLLILTGVLLTLGPEFVYLRDNFGVRLNTVFKFYYQAWVLFGVAALFGLDYLWRHSRPAAAVTGLVYGTALGLALLFPAYAVPSRAAFYRGPAGAGRQPATLDGMAHLLLDRPDEFAAISWLNQAAPAGAVVVEAVGGQYSRDYARVSAHTGLPTLLGWPGHEYQWRGATPEPATREPAVEQIYREPGWTPRLTELLNRYDVAYVYIGPVERRTYGEQGEAKFRENLPVAYANNTVTIYRWQPAQ